MKISRKLLLLTKSKNPIRDIVAYFQGNYRYKIYYSKYLGWLMRTHIRQQIKYRIDIMNPICFQQGQCIVCGCDTTHLQMANKTCDGKEYPPIVGRIKWICYNRGEVIKDFKGNFWLINNQGETERLIEAVGGYRRAGYME